MSSPLKAAFHWYKMLYNTLNIVAQSPNINPDQIEHHYYI